MSRESALSRVPTMLPNRKATRVAALSQVAARRACPCEGGGRGQRPQHARTLLVREPGDLVAGRRWSAPAVRAGKATRPKPAMNGNERSDLAIVAVKPANEPGRLGEERVEPRAGAKGNAAGPHGVRHRNGPPRHRGSTAYAERHERGKGKGSPPCCTTSTRSCCAKPING